MLLPTPELEWSDTVLVPETRVTKGPPDAVPNGPLGSRILLGGPVCQQLDAQTVTDAAVSATLVAEQDVGYTVVHLATTFNPAMGEVIQRAWVGIELSSPGNNSAPIAWSMSTERRSAPASTSREIEIKADLKIVSAGTRSLQTRDSVFLVALNLLRSDPMWEFSRTKSVEIGGSERLVLVVRSPSSCPVYGRLKVMALIGRRHLKAIPYNVLLAEGGTPTFTVR